MYYNKEDLERWRKQAEENLKEREKELEGVRYKSQDGTNIACLHCGHDLFHKGTALLNTRGMTFFGFDWLNESAVTLICKRCGYIHWFLKELEESD